LQNDDLVYVQLMILLKWLK